MADRKRTLVEKLFAEHRTALQGFFQRRIRAKADAPDLAQEVYLRMLRVSDSDAIRNPELYLYTVANNLVKEHAVLDRRQASDVDIDDATVQQQLGDLPAFDGELDATQRILRLRVVLTQLSPKCRAAVVLALQARSSLPGGRRATRRVCPHGEEVSGAGARALPAPHGATGVNP